MPKSLLSSEFAIVRDPTRCIACQVCVRQCAFGVHSYDEESDEVSSDEDQCVGCQRCASLCPTHALTVSERPQEFRSHASWTPQTLRAVYKQAETGGVLLSGMGTDKAYPVYWDRLVINAAQVTNPSIDPLREPMELRTYIGRKPERLDFDRASGKPVLKTRLDTLLKIEIPVLFSAMSYGSISYNACLSLARAARQMGILWNTGEGGLHRTFYEFGPSTIVQVASGRFGVTSEYLHTGAAIEIKIGQGAKPGIGGHLPGEKVSDLISETRMIPAGTDAISPAPHHDIYSIEDLKQLIFALKEATNYTKPVFVKIGAVHNVAAIASGIVRAGADAVVLDGIRGGTGAAPQAIRDNVGIPIEFAVAAVDERLRREGIRHEASLLIAGGVRNSADVVKAIALGADAVYIASAALVAMGCHMCQKCYTGRCNWGIATQDPYLVKRLNPDVAVRRLCNLLRAWALEIKEFLGGMGLNSIESLRGNRLHLRGIGLNDVELDILGVLPAGR